MAIDIGSNRPRPTPPIPRPERTCLARVVERIDQIQKEALLEDSVIGCSAPELGDNVRNQRLFNTRPFSLYLPNGERLAIVVEDNFTPFNDEPLQTGLNLDNLNIEINNLENSNPAPTTQQTIRGSASNRVTNISTPTTTRPTARLSTLSNIPERANVFRIEQIEGNCCTLRALLPRRGSGRNRFVATCTFCTVDLDKIVCIQCFDDTFVNLARCFED